MIRISSIILILLVWTFAGDAQDNGRSIQDAGQGRRLIVNSPSIDSYVAESKSPFFSDKWMPSTLVFANGNSQSGVSVKLNLFENKIHYLDEAGNESISTDDFKEVVLADTANRKVHRFINSASLKATGVEPGWYELLCIGRVELYKKIIKTLPRSMTQNSEDELRPLETSIRFFLLTNGKIFNIKRGKDIPFLIEAKKMELQEYIKSKKLNGKSGGDMIEIVNYYNTIAN